MYIYKNPSYSIDERVEDLLSRMTLEEKLIQLGGYFEDHPEINRELGVGSFGFMTQHLSPEESAEEYNARQKKQIEETRLGIPAFRSVEGIYALMRNGSTSFPQPIAQAAAFDPACIEIVAEVLGNEMKSLGVSEVLSPVLNLTRDPRWGRANETYGEDPYLIGMMGSAYVKKMESMGVQTDLKHFIANMGLNGQFGGATYFSERIMREYYFPAFKKCVDAGASSIMMAYNTFNAIPCAANKWLMQDIIKGEWSFKGFIRSDGESAEFIYEDGGIYETPEDLAVGLINSGCDKISPGWFYGEPLRDAVNKGLVKEARIDDAVKRFLRQKFEAGLFEDPYVDPSQAEKINNSSANRNKALEVAKKSLVLLKNENKILPFSKNVQNIAVVGPLADWLMVGHYGGYGRHEVTMVEGVKNLIPNANIFYEKGVEMRYFAYPAIDSIHYEGAIKAEYFDNAQLSGKPKFVKYENRIEYDWLDKSPQGIPNDNFSVRWTGKIKSPITGKVKIGATADDGVRVWLDEEMIIDMWSGGSRRLGETEINIVKDRIYDFKMEYFDGGFNAYAQLGWNINLEEDIIYAVEAAEKSDVIIAVMGSYENENWDRADLDLPAEQEKMILELSKLNKPMVVVLQHGSVITMYDWIDKVDAVLMSWYPGCEGGNAMAQTIFGDNNPGGKLPITFPKVTGQVPLNYNMLPKGKMEIKFIGDFNEPQFSFGHGLSYTEFSYNDLTISSDTISTEGSLDISFDLKNIGDYKGDEVVQLYIRDKYASVAQPLLKLVDFKRIALDQNESRKIVFELKTDKLKIWDINMEHVVEPGEFIIMIGTSSDNIKLSTNFIVN
jgi:beta-glucosidase